MQFLIISDTLLSPSRFWFQLWSQNPSQSLNFISWRHFWMTPQGIDLFYHKFVESLLQLLFIWYVCWSQELGGVEAVCILNRAWQTGTDSYKKASYITILWFNITLLHSKQGIVGREFLPRGPDMVTRCPLVLQLHYDKVTTYSWLLWSKKLDHFLPAHNCYLDVFLFLMKPTLNLTFLTFLALEEVGM